MPEPGAASAAPGSGEGAGAPKTQGLRGLEPPQGRAASAAWPALPHPEAETQRTPEAGAEAPPSAPGQGHRLTGRARGVCRRQSASADPGGGGCWAAAAAQLSPGGGSPHPPGRLSGAVFLYLILGHY